MRTKIHVVMMIENENECSEVTTAGIKSEYLVNPPTQWCEFTKLPPIQSFLSDILDETLFFFTF